ncbi:MAG: 3-keto-disaccharide hydrolase [Candidatus Latescibacterota bacterium]
MKLLIASLPAIMIPLVAAVALTQDTQPRIITAPPGKPPSDAIVLFDGRSLDAWSAPDGKPPAWLFRDGAMIVNGGGIITRREFGDIQLHLEWAAPTPAKGSGQDRGNSGIYLQGAYEVQVLDSHGNETYTNGMAGAIYEQAPPLVNAARPAGEWQTYDIVFRAPIFDSAGKVLRRPVVTVFWNGILIQDHVEIEHPTRASLNTTVRPKGPIFLQDHGHPVKYRNIWVREL